MMRKIVFYALAAFCLSSCTNDTNSESGSATTPLSIASVFISGLKTKSTTPATGTSMGIFRLIGTGDYTTSQDNISYTLGAGGTWAPAVSTSQILLGPKAATLCAYLPYNASATLTAVPLVSQIDGTANDICYKNAITASSSAPAVSFDMQHALSKITFTLSPSASYTGTCAISNITIANAGILKNSSLNLQTGIYTNESTPTGSVSFNPAIAGITSGNSATASVLMVPVTTTLTGAITLTINVDGINKIALFDASLLPTLAAGSNYNIPVTISNAYLAVGSVSTVDWSSVAVPGTVYLQLPESNCYIVAPNRTISIPVSRAYAANADNFSNSTMPWTTGLLWTDVPNPLTTSGTIASITGVNTSSVSGFITVTTGNATGNAVVYVKNSNGDICWSWHIWVTDYDPSITNISYNSLIWMDRNLGATNNTPGDVGCMGLYYQWGRKDPFPGPTTVSGSAEKTLYGAVTSITKTAVAASPNLVPAIQNPATFYCGTGAKYYDWYSNSSTHNDALWGFSKTVYDPCPVGWKVPANGAWPSSLTTITWLSYGATFADGWYQASGYCDGRGGAFYDVGNSGYYWSSTVNSTGAYCLGFVRGYVIPPSGVLSRAFGCSVRCVKE